MSRQRTFDPTERLGVAAVEHIFAELGWIFREQVVADYGIDAQVEITQDGRPTGQLIGVQIKTGPSYFRGSKDSIAFYADESHMDYWTSHALPTILVLHNPDTGETLWQKIDRETAHETAKGWRIDVQRANVLNADSKDALIGSGVPRPEIARRQRFAADKSFMKEFIGQEAYVSIDVWVNKHWKIREIEFRFGEIDKPDADFVMSVEVTWGYDVPDVMRHFFPWLEYDYAEEIEDSSGEVEGHVLEVHLTDAAKGFLAAERYFEDGPPAPRGDENHDDFGDPDEWQIPE